MRNRLLIGRDRGTALVESVGAIMLILFLSLGVVQVALLLYGRNVLAASAHEGARAAAERGGSTTEASSIARSTVMEAAGNLIRDLSVTVVTREIADRRVVHVVVSGSLGEIGPFPFSMRASTSATVTKEEL